MSKTTVIEEYDENGKLIKKTTITGDDATPKEKANVNIELSDIKIGESRSGVETVARQCVQFVKDFN